MALPPERSRPRLLQTLAGQALTPPPIWLMRQAGRYLPEYRAVRAKAGGFLELCYTPALAAEVTLQPIRRYGFDAAILFSDILVVPDALGQRVEFVEGEGPRLEPVRSEADLARLNGGATRTKFARVCETVARLRQDLPHGTALIGFCGAPWTVATYMVGGQGSPDQREARLWAYRDRAGFGRLIEILVEASIDYLSMQVEAGADVLQIFDTWAGSLPPREFEAWVVDADAAHRGGAEGEAPAGADHRLSARGGAEDRALCRGDRRAGSGLRHRHGCGAYARPGELGRSRGARQSRSDGADCGRGGAAGANRCAAGGFVRGAAYLQSGPRHPAGDAAGACGVACGARAWASSRARSDHRRGYPQP